MPAPADGAFSLIEQGKLDPEASLISETRSLVRAGVAVRPGYIPAVQGWACRRLVEPARLARGCGGGSGYEMYENVP